VWRLKTPSCCGAVPTQMFFTQFIAVVSQINVYFTAAPSYTTNSMMWRLLVSDFFSSLHQAYQFVRTVNKHLIAAKAVRSYSFSRGRHKNIKISEEPGEMCMLCVKYER
jgi:hypothetical protein